MNFLSSSYWVMFMMMGAVRAGGGQLDLWLLFEQLLLTRYPFTAHAR
jgi:hypothetical protein